MSHDTILRAAERKAWTSQFQDGLWDILLGMLLAATAARALTDNVAWYLLMVLAVPIYLVGKRFITLPRIGRVTFSANRVAKRLKAITILSVSVVATLGLMVAAIIRPDALSNSVGAILAVTATLVVCAVAYWTEIGRLYVYGLLLGGSIAVTEIFGDPIGPLAFFVSSALITLVGLAFLVRFLRNCPIPKEDTPREGAGQW